jgi:uncharacterized protein YqgC (DUF456 family)
MTSMQIMGLALALLLMLLGLIGTVVPGIPGTPIVMAVAIAHRLYFGAASVSNFFLAVIITLALFSLALDYLATVLGARKLGATWRGILGAIVGAVVGLFFGPFGILLGPFLGALLFELVGGREFPDAARAGAGALLGLVVGAAGKLACCVAMIGIFAVNVVARSGGS